MTPLLFPFTWMPEAHLTALERHFSRPTVLAPSENAVSAPMSRWGREDRVDLRFPVQGDADRFDGIVQGYRRWAQTHPGGGLTLARTLEPGIPFFDESHVARIRSEIRRGGTEAEAAPLDRLTRARIFLLMAEGYDRQGLEVDADLERLEDLEAAMIAHLREGSTQEGSSESGSAVSSPPDPGGFMTEERLGAWARLYLAADPTGLSSPILVTTSRAALETLLDSAPDPGTVKSAGTDRAGADAAAAAVERLRAGEPPQKLPSVPESPLLLLYYLPDIDPVRLFSRFLRSGAPAGSEAGSPGGTMFGWVNTTI